MTHENSNYLHISRTTNPHNSEFNQFLSTTLILNKIHKAETAKLKNTTITIPGRLISEGNGDIIQIFAVHRNPLHRSRSGRFGISLGTHRKPANPGDDPNLATRAIELL